MTKELLKYFIHKTIRCMPISMVRHLSAELQEERLRRSQDYQKIKQLIAQAVAVSEAHEYDKAESFLHEAATIDPGDARIAPHLGRIRFLKTRSAMTQTRQQIQSMREVMGAMRRELETNNPIYIPSEFWDTIGKFHIRLLEDYGIENFKRTVAHSYQNWFLSTRDDPQVQQLLKTWPEHFATEPWFNTMEVPDHVGLPLSLLFDDPTYPLADLQKREMYRITVGMLWELVRNSDHFNILEKLNESEIGNPVRLWRKGHLISSDIAHSVRERNLMLDTLSCKGDEEFIVGELGAGHGRLAEVFAQTTNYKYCIFDITPALYVSQWYIKQRFPHEKIFEFRPFDSFEDIRAELEGCRFAFFTANQIEKIPDKYLHLFINMNSLTEMRVDQIKNFLSQIGRLTTRAFLSRQWFHWDNPIDKHSVNTETFNMGDGWKLALDKNDDIYPAFFNQIWVPDSKR